MSSYCCAAAVAAATDAEVAAAAGVAAAGIAAAGFAAAAVAAAGMAAAGVAAAGVAAAAGADEFLLIWSNSQSRIWQWIGQREEHIALSLCSLATRTFAVRVPLN